MVENINVWGTLQNSRWLYYRWLKQCYLFCLRAAQSYRNLLSADLNEKSAQAIEFVLAQEESQAKFWIEAYSLYQAYLMGDINEKSFLMCDNAMRASHINNKLWLDG